MVPRTHIRTNKHEQSCKQTNTVRTHIFSRPLQTSLFVCKILPYEHERLCSYKISDLFVRGHFFWTLFVCLRDVSVRTRTFVFVQKCMICLFVCLQDFFVRTRTFVFVQKCVICLFVCRIFVVRTRTFVFVHKCVICLFVCLQDFFVRTRTFVFVQNFRFVCLFVWEFEIVWLIFLNPRFWPKTAIFTQKMQIFQKIFACGAFSPKNICLRRFYANFFLPAALLPHNNCRDSPTQ